MTDYSFRCHPWDLAGPGVEENLALLAGELGVSTILLSATGRRFSGFRPRYRTRRVRVESGAYFAPSDTAYGTGRMRPVAASWTRSRGSFDRILQTAAKTGVRCQVRVECCATPALVARHAIAARVDAFGEPDSERLCPSNAEVRDYVCSLVGDLASRAAVDGVVIASADFGSRAESMDVDLSSTFGPLVEELLSLCVCPSCRQRAADAGIDADAVHKTILDHVERAMRLESVDGNTLADLAASDGELRRYVEYRAETVTSLLRLVRERVDGRIFVEVDGDPQSGQDVAALASLCDGLVVSRSPDESERFSAIVTAAGGMGRVHAGVRCHPPEVVDSQELVTSVKALADAGCAGVIFSDYGAAPEPCLDWVRQAVRYARREADAESIV